MSAAVEAKYAYSDAVPALLPVEVCPNDRHAKVRSASDSATRKYTPAMVNQ
jgi:hypothetical protein